MENALAAWSLLLTPTSRLDRSSPRRQARVKRSIRPSASAVRPELFAHASGERRLERAASRIRFIWALVNSEARSAAGAPCSGAIHARQSQRRRE